MRKRARFGNLLGITCVCLSVSPFILAQEDTLGQDGVYAALGVFGQMIWIDPSRNIVIALHSAWPNAGDSTLREHRTAFIEALAAAL